MIRGRPQASAAVAAANEGAVIGCQNGPMRSARGLRVVRGTLAAAIATFVALLSHVAAGGALPGWAGIVVPAILSMLVCIALAGRRLSLWRLSLAVAVSQVLFHTLFVLGMAAPSTGAAIGHAHHAAPVALAALSDAATASAVSTAWAADAAMWVLHGLAAILTVAVLHRGERTAQRLMVLARHAAAWVHRTLAAPLAVPRTLLPRRAVVTGDLVAVRIDAPHLRTLRRRGPPAFC